MIGTFTRSIDNALNEIDNRLDARNGLCTFGISFLDDALIGIRKDDLVLVGAPSGAGKTQLAVSIAAANISLGKKVYFFALEASQFEIERRIKYQIISQMYFDNPDRKPLSSKLSYEQWSLGDFINDLGDEEVRAMAEFRERYANLMVYYKGDSFTINDLVETMLSVANDADLFVIDHAHYFDFDEDENRAIKALAKTTRTIAIHQETPIILVAHLRKRDRHSKELVAGLDEFHGSSDLTKIATRVITIAPGTFTENHNYETFVRIPKDRHGSRATRFVARMIFNPSKGAYEKKYRLTDCYVTRDEVNKSGMPELDPKLIPGWAKGASYGPFI